MATRLVEVRTLRCATSRRAPAAVTMGSLDDHYDKQSYGTSYELSALCWSQSGVIYARRSRTPRTSRCFQFLRSCGNSARLLFDAARRRAQYTEACRRKGGTPDLWQSLREWRRSRSPRSLLATDRLARNPVDGGAVIYELGRHNIAQIVTLGGQCRRNRRRQVHAGSSIRRRDEDDRRPLGRVKRGKQIPP